MVIGGIGCGCDGGVGLDVCRYGVYGVGDGGVWCGMKGWLSKLGGVVVDLDLLFVVVCVLREEEGYVDGKCSGVIFLGVVEEGVKSNK